MAHYSAAGFHASRVSLCLHCARIPRRERANVKQHAGSDSDKGRTDQAGDSFRGGHLCSVTDAPPGYDKKGSVPSSGENRTGRIYFIVILPLGSVSATISCCVLGRP